MELARRLGPRVAHLHLGDGSGSARDEHLEPGTGRQPVGRLLEDLAVRGYRGVISVEVSTRRAGGQQDREALLTRSLNFARERFAVPYASTS